MGFDPETSTNALPTGLNKIFTNADSGIAEDGYMDPITGPIQREYTLHNYTFS